MRPFNTKDVQSAMFIIHSNKSPGSDGYGSNFFKKSWRVIGEDVIKVVLQFLGNGKLLKQVNATIICLIPKIYVPQIVNQFRPTSCFNVLYKCISEVLCVRMRKALSDLVSKNQTTFVAGRSLVHNVLICHDLMKHYKRKKTPRSLMKIDLNKAYDMVSWDL